MTFTAESNDSSLTKATGFAARPGRSWEDRCDIGHLAVNLYQKKIERSRIKAPIQSNAIGKFSKGTAGPVRGSKLELEGELYGTGAADLIEGVETAIGAAGAKAAR